jgi:hypothetical protein
MENDMTKRHKNRSLASVQEQLPLETITGDVLRLRSGEYRAVLQTGSVNFALKSEPEQEAILAGYRRFLNALAYPLQVLVRVVPTDVERYFAGLRGSDSARGGTMLRRLAADHEAFVRGIARERTLLDRRFYVIVPAGRDGSPERRRPPRPWQRRGGEQDQHRSDLLAGEQLVALWRDAVGARPSAHRGELIPTPVVTRVALTEEAAHA